MTLDSEAIDRAWGDEAEERIRAYEAGELSARDGDDVSGDIKKRDFHSSQVVDRPRW
jgi:hypothetical protein